MTNYKKIAKIIVVFILSISCLAAYKLKDVKFNYVIEDYFPKGDSDAEYFLQFLKKFDNDVDFILLGIKNEKGIFNAEFVRKIDSLTKVLSSYDAILNVSSPTNLKILINSSAGVFPVPVIHKNEMERLHEDSVKIYQSEEFVGSFFSTDAKSVSIYMRNKDILSPETSDSIMTYLTEVLSSYHFDEYHLMGRVRAHKYYVTEMRNEIVLFVCISAILLVAFMYLIYRNVWSIIIASAVILFSVIWTIALVLLVESELNLMMTLMPTMLFVVGMSDLVHILTKFIEEIRLGKDKTEAIKITFKEVGMATFLTSLTTAIGFISLLSSNAPPIRFFGIYVSIGVVITFLISIFLTPSLLLLIKTPKITLQNDQSRLFWNKLLRNSFLWTLKYRKWIIPVNIALIVISLFGINKVRINNFFLEDLNDKSELKKDLMFFEKNFAGIRPLEIAVETSFPSILDYEVMLEMDKVEQFIKNEYKAGLVFSPVSVIKSLNQSTNGGNKAFYKLPENKNDYDNLIQKAKKYKFINRLSNIVSEDQKTARISAKMNDIGSYELQKINLKFAEFISAEINQNIIKPRLTGAAYLLDSTNQKISVSLIEGLVIAVLIIASIMAVTLRSFSMLIISLIPNIIPILIIAGIIGFAHFDLKMSTALIFTIAFGICVDDTIHFLSKLKIELMKGKSLIYAVKRTYLSTGKAIILTSVILSTGFITFMLSDFESTIQIGLLISITLVIAVLADLILLPVLLLYFYKK